jgi:hypothetical protein
MFYPMIWFGIFSLVFSGNRGYTFAMAGFQYIVLYGAGTPSAYIHRRARSKKEAAALLEIIRDVWRRHADRFTLHSSEDVIEKGFALKAWVYGPEPAPAQKRPEGTAEHD